jgi:undecaprenyl-diphosphatase
MLCLQNSEKWTVLTLKHFFVRAAMLLYLWMMIQIICESLPISSSGHVALLQRILLRQGSGGQVVMLGFSDLLAFDYILQGVSAIIFLIYFFSSWWQLVVGKPIKISSLFDLNIWKKNIVSVFLFGLVADGMTFLWWSLDLAHQINLPLACGFMITAGALWSMQFAHQKKDLDIWSLKNGLIVGFVQGCALLPGISRFGTTVAILQWLGYSGRIAFTISFLLQWPLIVAGSLVGFFALHDTSILKIVESASFLMVVFASSLVGYGLMCGVGKIIDKNLLWKFSYYMIIPIIIALWI